MRGGCGAHTIVVLSESQIGRPFAYNCSGCGKKLEFGQILLKAPDSLSFHVFGDESCADNMVLYGLLLLNENDVEGAENDFVHIIKSAGVPIGSRFHAKEVFNGIARSKSVWSHLSDKEIWAIAKKLLISLKSHRAMFNIGIVDRESYPKKMPSGTGQEILVSPEHLYSLAFQAAFITFDEHGLINPQTSIRLWIDPQKSRIALWGGGKIQVQTLYKYKHIAPEKIEETKPILLDAADLFTYVAGRAVSNQPSTNKQICKELFELCNPNRSDTKWVP